MNDAPDDTLPTDAGRQSSLSGLIDVATAVMAVAIGISAIVVAVLGQTALAAVLAVVALGMGVRLWRVRRRR